MWMVNYQLKCDLYLSYQLGQWQIMDVLASTKGNLQRTRPHLFTAAQGHRPRRATTLV
jgi:hypothetical protein